MLRIGKEARKVNGEIVDVGRQGEEFRVTGVRRPFLYSPIHLSFFCSWSRQIYPVLSFSSFSLIVFLPYPSANLTFTLEFIV